jgi:hypothetical protein
MSYFLTSSHDAEMAPPALRRRRRARRRSAAASGSSVAQLDAYLAAADLDLAESQRRRLAAATEPS